MTPEREAVLREMTWKHAPFTYWVSVADLDELLDAVRDLRARLAKAEKSADVRQRNALSLVERMKEMENEHDARVAELEDFARRVYGHIRGSKRMELCDEIDRLVPRVQHTNAEAAAKGIGGASRYDGIWRCSECGEMNQLDGRWRWNGDEWQHHHGYPVGHVPARYFGPAAKGIAQKEGAK